MLTMRELRHLAKSTYVFFVKTAIVDGLTEVLSLGSYYGQLQFTFLFNKSDGVYPVNGAAKANGFMECYEDGKPHCDKCKERNNER